MSHGLRLPKRRTASALGALRTFHLATVVVALLVTFTAGCLRPRAASELPIFHDTPQTAEAPPRPVRRLRSSLGQAGLDERSREIEASLGVDQSPPWVRK